MNDDMLTKAIAWGFVGGFAATVTMDVVCAAFFAGLGMPVELIYSFIGNVAGSFFLRIGIDLPGSRLLGAVVHFLLGIALGGLLGLVTPWVKALRVETLKRALVIGILYTEIVSQPIVASAPLLGSMTASETFQWYALSTGMHLIYGVILGAILSWRQKAVASPNYAT
jgi:hypothetical protein